MEALLAVIHRRPRRAWVVAAATVVTLGAVSFGVVSRSKDRTPADGATRLRRRRPMRMLQRGGTMWMTWCISFGSPS